MNIHAQKVIAFFFSLTISILIVLIVLPFSCGPSMDEIDRGKLKGKDIDCENCNGDFYVKTIDSCEYVVFDTYKRSGICHKGNCKFCKERNK